MSRIYIYIPYDSHYLTTEINLFRSPGSKMDLKVSLAIFLSRCILGSLQSRHTNTTYLSGLFGTRSSIVKSKSTTSESAILMFYNFYFVIPKKNLPFEVKTTTKDHFDLKTNSTRTETTITNTTDYTLFLLHTTDTNEFHSQKSLQSINHHF